MQAMSRRKTLKQTLHQHDENHDDTTTQTTGLKRTLTAVDLVLYGVGSSVGAGIYVLVGLGAAITGPAIALSFGLTGASCILTALAYAEFAAQIPVTGSAFIYLYVAFGEVWAWLVGWNLTLGYGFTSSVVARAWADYVGNFLLGALPANTTLTTSLLQACIAWATEWKPFPSSDYVCSPLSTVLVAGSTVILLRGAQDSSQFNNVMTALNISVLLAVVGCSLWSRSATVDNLTPFFAPEQPVASLMAGAGLVFFAFIGFDMVASLSEEVVQPARNMPIGIVGSLLASTTIYITVALAVVSMAPIPLLGVKVPIVNALLANACCTADQQQELVQSVVVTDPLLIPVAGDNYSDHSQKLFAACLSACPHYIRPGLAVASQLVSAGAIVGLVASCFTSLMGQPRILYSLARDGLIPKIFAQVDPLTRVPRVGIWVTAIVTALLACFVPLDALANLISLGTLMVFTLVDAGVIILRLRQLDERTGHLSTPTLTETTRWVVVFLLAVLSMAMLLSHAEGHGSGFFAGMLAIVAIKAAHCIATARANWKITPNAENVDATTFTCPWVPVVPLCGMTANTVMMGSLPLSSWLLCLVWLAAGMMIYLCYGLHHSVLNQHDSTRLSDETPLLWHRVSTLEAVDDADEERRDYDSTVGVSLEGLHSRTVLAVAPRSGGDSSFQ